MSLPLASGSIPPLAPGDRPVNWAVTGRFGGRSSGPYAELNLAEHVGDDVDAVLHNRALVARWAGASQAAFVRAVHGAGVAWVGHGDVVPEADALLTTEVGLPLVALGADCALIGVAAPGVVGVVHCGWRGLVAGVISAAIGALRAYSEGPVLAIVGPSICARCYPVGEECATEVQRACPEAVPDPTHIDLHAGVCAQLARENVGIEDRSSCTFESTALFSHRREAPTGRHGLMMWRADDVAMMAP